MQRMARMIKTRADNDKVWIGLMYPEASVCSHGEPDKGNKMSTAGRA